MQRFAKALKDSIQNENWFGGLFLALCLPDICGALETPDEQVGVRYKRWFKQNLGAQYSPMFTEDDCYHFRCSCLHQGLDKHVKIAHEKIHFITPPPRNNVIHLNKFNDVLQMQVDVFCKDMCNAVEAWEVSIAKNNPDILVRQKDLIQIHPIESLRPFIVFN